VQENVYGTNLMSSYVGAECRLWL